MDGLIRMERQKFPFTIENILSKYPNGNGDRLPCGTSGVGLHESTVSPTGVKTDTIHHTCLHCCYCSHCGDIFQSDFIHEGKTLSSACFKTRYILFTNLKFDLLPAACQYGWPPVMLSDPCRLGEAHREEKSSSQVQRRTRRHRTIFTEEQLDALEELFLQNQYPDVNTRERLAQSTHLREERVEVRLLSPL